MMIRASGFLFDMPLDKQVVRLKALAEHMQESTPIALKAIGHQVIAWAIADYREKSDGGTAGGASWQPITDSAIASRLRKRQPWKDQTSALLSLQQQSWPLLDELRRKLPPGEDRQPNRGAIAESWMQNTPEGKKLRDIQKQRAKIRSQRKAKIKSSKAAARIGIDTGRLINSLVFGISELSDIRVPAIDTGAGGKPLTDRAAFDISGNGITVGSNMSYAKYFDERRPIFPDGFIDDSRKDKLSSLAVKAIELDFKQRQGNG